MVRTGIDRPFGMHVSPTCPPSFSKTGMLGYDHPGNGLGNKASINLSADALSRNPCDEAVVAAVEVVSEQFSGARDPDLRVTIE